MNVDLSYELEKKLKITIANRSPRLTIKKTIEEAIELWIARESIKEGKL